MAVVPGPRFGNESVRVDFETNDRTGNVEAIVYTNTSDAPAYVVARLPDGTSQRYELPAGTQRMRVPGAFRVHPDLFGFSAGWPA